MTDHSLLGGLMGATRWFVFSRGWHLENETMQALHLPTLGMSFMSRRCALAESAHFNTWCEYFHFPMV